MHNNVLLHTAEKYFYTAAFFVCVSAVQISWMNGNSLIKKSPCGLASRFTHSNVKLNFLLQWRHKFYLVTGWAISQEKSDSPAQTSTTMTTCNCDKIGTFDLQANGDNLTCWTYRKLNYWWSTPVWV